MLNAGNTMENLEKWFAENYKFWFNNKSGDNLCIGDERESFRRSFEWDLIESFNVQGGVLHEYGKMNGEELDVETCIRFFKIKCQDLYGKDWQKHWENYQIKEAGERSNTNGGKKLYRVHFMGYYGYDVDVVAESKEEAERIAEPIFEEADTKDFFFESNETDCWEI